MNNIPRKKILYLITKSTWGGAGRYVYDLATNLPKENFEATVVLGGNGELKDKLEARDIHTITISSLQRDIALWSEIKAFLKLVQAIRKEKPDILHTNSSKAGALGALAGRLTQIPKIIFTAHGWAFNEKRPLFSRTAITFVHWFTILLSHKTIAVSYKTKEQVLKKMPFIKNRVVVIHNGIAKITFEEQSEARKKLFPKSILKNIQEDTLWFGTISELHKNKGLDYIIRAIGQISKTLRSDPVGKKPFIFVIISGGEEKAKLAELIAKEKLQNTVFLVGHKKNAASLLKALDVFTLTSRTEAFPYVLLEAGLAELSVIASSVGGVPEIVSKDCGILVKAGDIDEIAHAIVQLLKNERARKDLGTNLKKYVLQNFSTQRMVKKTLQYYN
jgi:glycosyltransferase involved in cell wall biosynthesis